MISSPSKKELREFGILFSIALPLLIGWLIPIIFGHAFRTWTLFISVPFFLIAILRPRILYFPYIFWIKLGNLLGWINGHIILGLVFIIVLQPIAFFMKLFGYNPLYKKLNNKNSYRENTENNSTNLERIF